MQSIPFVLRVPKLQTTRSIAFSASAIATAASKMVKGIRVHRFGGPEVLKYEDVQIGAPKRGEIKVKNQAIGVNFIDVYIRRGSFGAYRMPVTPGYEAAGIVTAVGPGVTSTKIGELVAFTAFGAYAEEQIVPAEEAILVPPSIEPVVAASVLLKGMTALMLVRFTFKVEPGHIVLVHAAAGGTGSLLCQWANNLGATVIGTVSTKEKAAQAKEDGCHHTILYKEENFAARVNEITSGRGVDVVYDAVGKDTFQGSVECLKPHGYIVSYGSSSGAPNSMSHAISTKSLVLRRPALSQINTDRDRLLENAGEVFRNVASGALHVRVNHTYPLSECARAHADLEGRRTSGSIVLIP